MPTPSERDRPALSNAAATERSTQRRGAWLEWQTAMAVCELDLRRPSLWRVFLAVLFTSERYGGREARLSTADLTRMTGLAARTVKGAVADLVSRRLLIRTARYERYVVNLAGMPTVPAAREETLLSTGGVVAERGADRSAPRACTEACTSSTSLYVSSDSSEKSGGTFTHRQSRLIADVMAEADELLGRDVAQLLMPGVHARSIGLPVPISYGDALRTVAESGDKVMARDFTKAILALRADERVVGRDLSGMSFQ
jgi:hypothetical protein